MFRPQLRFLSAALCCAFIAVSVTACGSNYKKTTTTEADLVETVHPPEGKALFGEGSTRDINLYQNKFPIEDPVPGCECVVSNINVLTSGWTKGGLRFFTEIRGNFGDPPNYTYPETNDSGDLGPVATGNLYLYYKYEPEITFAGEVKDGFYGQMISQQIRLDKPPKPVTFRDWTPKNDFVGREWNIPPGKDFVETKKNCPVVAYEKEARTLRFIDAPGGPAGAFGVGVEGTKYYVLIYAGACDKVTHVKCFRIDFPVGKKPSMTEVPTALDLLKEVPGILYSPNPQRQWH
ncbi:MAG TPA: hypothetical protein V6D17_20375 [Candidatus Obscuribacterales bacterium]